MKYDIIYNNINCQKNKSEWIKTAWGVKSFIPVKNSEESIKNALIKYGPLVAAMKTCNYFGEFKGTFYDCDAARATGNHAVVIVGFGTEGGKTYWICKNSFGGNWGDGGYFKIFSGRADIGYITYAISEPTFATAINKLCEDADGDGFCNWGLGAKPKAGCPVCNETLKDCDDTDKNVGSCYN